MLSKTYKMAQVHINDLDNYMTLHIKVHLVPSHNFIYELCRKYRSYCIELWEMEIIMIQLAS